MTDQPTVNKLPVSVARTSAGLRDAIFDEIDALRNGTSNPKRANSLAKLAMGIVETVRMELEVQKALNNGGVGAAAQVGEGMQLAKPLALGQPSAPSQLAN